MENIILENIKEFSKYLIEKYKLLEFNIPEIVINRNDTTLIRDKIISITPNKRKKLKINKSTLWYQQKKIKEGKTIKVYNRTKVKI